MIKIKQFTFNLFGESTFVAYDPVSREAAIVDPGISNLSEEERLNDFIEKEHLTVKYLVNTHLHVDHAMGDGLAKKRYGVGVTASGDDAYLGAIIAQQAQMFNLPYKLEAVRIDNEVKEGDRLMLGDNVIEVIHVPGHSAGSIALYAPASHWVIVGDALFKGSIGRTDLPGGDHATLINSIRKKLMTLPDETIVLPGHGPYTTIGEERRSNPYI
ncbi:MAG: MBL fold metallo-hydrolase [Muribaculaceae bacterium]|nr:MBL fold metallo-hydrolase [Muribaculaceae bacterium]